MPYVLPYCGPCIRSALLTFTRFTVYYTPHTTGYFAWLRLLVSTTRCCDFTRLHCTRYAHTRFPHRLRISLLSPLFFLLPFPTFCLRSGLRGRLPFLRFVRLRYRFTTFGFGFPTHATRAHCVYTFTFHWITLRSDYFLRTLRHTTCPLTRPLPHCTLLGLFIPLQLYLHVLPIHFTFTRLL